MLPFMNGHDLYITKSSISQWHGPTRHVQGGFCSHTWQRQKKTVGQGRWWSCSSRAGTASPPSGLWLAVSVTHILGCSPAFYCYFGGQHSPSKFGVWGRSDIIIIHKFSIALFPTERAQRACSHTCA